MNTLLNEQGLLKALIDGKTDKYESEDMDNAEDVAIAQDTHTKAILADEVRKIENPYDPSETTLSAKRDVLLQGIAFNQALQAVLKLIEAKE